MALETKKGRNIITELTSSVRLPGMVKVKQLLDHSRIDASEIPGIIRGEPNREELRARIKPGVSVAITCGSREVANITTIIRAIVDFVEKCGGSPFIFPAIGSHGGVTAQGQREILASYHVIEDTMGCPIKTTMKVIQVDKTSDGMPVYVDRYVYEVDTIILCEHVKAHTAFRGPYESGTMKMAVIGLGKQEGAEIVHRNDFCGLGTMLSVIGRVVLEHVPVIGALALVENAFNQTCIIKGMLKEETYEEEPKLLIASKQRLGEIYFDNIDVLVMGQIGKDISRDGMDPSITGRFTAPYINEDIKVQHTVILDLIDETRRNCSGLELVDVTTKRLVDKTDVDCTYPNAVTSTVFCTPKIPLFTHSNKVYVRIALRTCSYIDHERPRVMGIKDAMNLEEVYISGSMLKKAEELNHVIVSGPPRDWVFNKGGNLW